MAVNELTTICRGIRHRGRTAWRPPCAAPFPRSYVVVDEGHAYHGAFGAHTALVLRRLRRLCARAHGSDPLFVVTSATMANPHHHARALLGLGPHEALEVVDADGSPAGPKLFALWNPPLTPDAKVRGKGPRGGRGKVARSAACSCGSRAQAAARRCAALQQRTPPAPTRTLRTVRERRQLCARARRG